MLSNAQPAMQNDYPRYRTLIYKQITDEILKVFFDIHTALRYGFIEVVY